MAFPNSTKGRGIQSCSQQNGGAANKRSLCEFEKAKTIRIQTLGQFKATSHSCMEMLCPNSALAKYAVGKVPQENPTMLGTSWHTPYKYKRHHIHQHSDQRARSCALRVVLKGSSVLQRIFNVFQCLVNVLQHARNATEQLWP